MVPALQSLPGSTDHWAKRPPGCRPGVSGWVSIPEPFFPALEETWFLPGAQLEDWAPGSKRVPACGRDTQMGLGPVLALPAWRLVLILPGTMGGEMHLL
jgi:hypothetical protein